MTNEEYDDSTKKDVCRILVLGSHRNRLDRVFALLHEMPPPAVLQDEATEICFLAAVATFDAYQDEKGNVVKYLLKIDYFPTRDDGSLDSTPQTLLPFFDEQSPSKTNDTFSGIATAVIGSGLDENEDAEKIRAFLDALSPTSSVPIVAPQPLPGFDSMAHEFAAYKQLDADGKAEATRQQSMGPGKIAKFAMDTAVRLLTERQVRRNEKRAQEAAAEQEHLAQLEEEAQAQDLTTMHFVDPDKKQFSCRKCRAVLFGEDDLEDPPHEPAQHNFGYRKGGAAQGTCQSIFLHSVPPWVTADTSTNEGKMECHKCGTKVGHWNWSGAQCSCGTWVCPAIQVPSSRVDEVLPRCVDALPTGTVTSPLVAALMQSQQG